MVSGRWRRKQSSPYVFWCCAIVAAGVSLVVAFMISLNVKLRPILLEMALTQTSNCITEAINQAVAEQAVAYSDLITFEYSSTGDIVAMVSNMSQSNLLRAELLNVALATLDGMETLEVGVPLGTIFDVDLFSGLGPDVDVRILYTGTASAQFENYFFDAGINQTCHQIFFTVDADLTVLLPGQRYNTNVRTKVCVAETVIIGKIPETYLHFGEQ